MRLAIVSRRDSPNTLDLIKAAESRGVECNVFPIKELAFDIERLLDHDFFSHDAYLFRGYNQNVALAKVLAQTLAAKGRIVIDQQLSRGLIYSKFHQAIIYDEYNIPHLPTYMAGSYEAWQSLGLQVSYPVVIKDIDSQKGKGVRLCSSKEILKDELEQNGNKIIIQQYANMSFDIRVLCVGESVIGAIKRESSGSDFRTNVSLGGYANLYELNEEEKALALSAHKTLGYDISGVDLAYDSEGRLFVIETNIAPEWQGFKQATGLDVADYILQYVQEKL